MNGQGSVSWGSAGAAAMCLLLVAGLAAAPPEQRSGGDPAAGELVAAALKAEFAAEGAESRQSLLAKAIALAPDYAPARWHSGFVKREGNWVALDEAPRHWLQDKRRAEYHKLRDAQAGTAAGEEALARWCQKNQLDNEARAHWMQVLRHQPNHKEALKNLGMTWYAGQLLRRDEVAQIKDAMQRFLNTKRRWEPVVTRWCAMVSEDPPALREELVRRLGSISDSAEMAALDEVIQYRCRTGKDDSKYRALSLQVVEVLAGIRKQTATESLVRYAVFHPMDDVRAAAVEPLKSRPLHTFVPALLSGMATPVEAEFYASQQPGLVHESGYRLYREGVQADWSSTYHSTIYPVVRGLGQGRRIRISLLPLVQQQKGVEQRLAGVQTQVEANNAVVTRRNERIARVLIQVAGADLGTNPLDWWKWWMDHTQREMSQHPAEPTMDYPGYRAENPVKPVYEMHAYRYAPVNVALSSSCFAKGTKVWTLSGVMPIEDVRVGDRVLSQDPETGELAYKPVLETTLRRPTERIRITLPNETILATGGHSFWVSGQGWRMAGELSASAPLHSVAGAVPIANVETVEPDKAWYDFSHNLVVADFGTYFVGGPGILVHDYTAEQPTDALVPGLLVP